MDIQRLRNITTDYFHTCIEDFCADLEWITGQQLKDFYADLFDGPLKIKDPQIKKDLKQKKTTHKELMYIMLINAVIPWLREHVTDPRFWDNKYDPTHVGEIDLPQPTESDRMLMIAYYRVQRN
jgi:hypothetical protein